MNHLSGLATLGILFVAQNFHHSLLFVHTPEKLLTRKMRYLSSTVVSYCQYVVFLVNGLHPYSRTPQCHISIRNLAGCCYDFASAVMVVRHMLRAQGRVPNSSFVFELTFSCLAPLPYFPANSDITVSRLMSSSLLPVPSGIAGCLFGHVLMFGVSPLIIFSG